MVIFFSKHENILYNKYQHLSEKLDNGFKICKIIIFVYGHLALTKAYYCFLLSDTMNFNFGK